MSGKDFRFGAGAKGKSSTLKNYADDEDNGVWYMSVKDVMSEGEKVSTTLIKQYIEEGKIQKAESLLASGALVRTGGDQTGRTDPEKEPYLRIPEDRFFVSDDTQNLFGDPLVRVNSPVWSMGWELWFSLTLPLAVACLARVRRDGAAIVGILAGVFVSHWCGYFPLRLCLTFWLGVILARHLPEVSALRLPVSFETVTLVALLGAIELAQAAQAGLLGPLDVLALAALQTLMNAACAGLVALAMTDGLVRRVLSTRPARFLGTVSFSLYLTHSLVIGGLEVVLPAIGVTDGLAQACVAVVSCLVCAAVFRRLVERPAIDLSRRVGNALGEAA